MRKYLCASLSDLQHRLLKEEINFGFRMCLLRKRKERKMQWDKTFLGWNLFLSYVWGQAKVNLKQTTIDAGQRVLNNNIYENLWHQDGNFSHALFYHLLFSFSQKFIDSVKRIFPTLVFHIVINVEVVKPNSIPYIVFRV